MSDRIRGFTVLLNEDYRDDDALEISSAINMIKGVASISNIVATPEMFLAEQKAKLEIREKIMKALE